MFGQNNKKKESHVERKKKLAPMKTSYISLVPEKKHSHH
jgi:hypothetical protein